jgi:uncharacterized protein YbaP (TraB family)
MKPRVVIHSLLAGLLALCATVAWSQSVAPAPSSSVTELAAVTVSGVQPGPGLWKVDKGGHVLWILGTLSPLPKRMQWQPGDVAEAIGASQEVLLSPSVTLKPNTNFFGRMFLLPSLIGVRKDPDDKTLQQVVPTDVYARWLVAKQKYIGDDRGVERYRPIFAAIELYRDAIKRSGMNSSGGVVRTVADMAKARGVKQTPVEYVVVIDSPRAAIKAFKQSPLEDVDCFRRTVDGIDAQMNAAAARANAWATGDLAALDKLIDSGQREACINAVTEAGVARRLGLGDVPQKIEATWLAAAERALTENRQTFALLPIESLLADDGVLAKLRAKGYSVQAPE